MNVKSLVVDHRFPLPARRLENIVQQILRTSKAEAIKAIHDGAVTVNRRLVRKPQAFLEEGDRVAVEILEPLPPKPKITALRPEALRIVYEDDAIAVVLKPAGLLTVPTPHREKETAISILTEMLQEQDPTAEAFCVHRLDRGVSGLLVFAKSLEIAKKIRDQFAERKPARTYVAFVVGDLKKPTGTIRSYLATDKSLNRYSTSEGEGELAITHYKVVERFGEFTRVQVQLETGRRNQIRVHLAELGHPIVGDQRYGRESALHRAWPYKRLALHAERLGFRHPITNEPLEFQASLPREMHQLMRSL